MNSKALIFFAFTLGACASDADNIDSQPHSSQNQERSVLSAGESVLSTQTLVFEGTQTHGSTAGDDPNRPTFCGMLRNVGTLAIIKLRDDGTYQAVREDCSGPYARPGYTFQTDVLAVAAGQSVETEINVVRLGEFPINQQPSAGDTWLATLRMSDGQLFVTRWIKISLVHNQAEALDTFEIPSNFDDLSADAVSMLDNMATECPNEHTSRLDDETFKSRAYDAVAYGCGVPSEDDGEEPVDRSEQCTDINPCD